MRPWTGKDRKNRQKWILGLERGNVRHRCGRGVQGTNVVLCRLGALTGEGRRHQSCRQMRFTRGKTGEETPGMRQGGQKKTTLTCPLEVTVPKMLWWNIKSLFLINPRHFYNNAGRWWEGKSQGWDLIWSDLIITLVKVITWLKV